VKITFLSKPEKSVLFFFSATRHQVLKICPELEILTNPILTVLKNNGLKNEHI